MLEGRLTAILGIDAAWTPHNLSGVALIRQANDGGWECVATAPSYEAFLSLSSHETNRRSDSKVPVAALVEVARHLAATDLNFIVADIPLAKSTITGRRRADDEISRRFGSKGYSAHSPSSVRPGRISDHVRDDFLRCGFPVVTKGGNVPARALIETYPHPVLLSLMKALYRVPYKVSKSRKLWPNKTARERSVELVGKLKEIVAALGSDIVGIICVSLGGLIAASQCAPAISQHARYLRVHHA